MIATPPTPRQPFLLSRRKALAAAGMVSASLTMSGATSALAQTPVASPLASPAASRIPCSINYDVGTEFLPGITTRPAAQQNYLEQELNLIRDELHAPMVGIFGTDIDRLFYGSLLAVEAGLDVRMQPRLINVPSETQLIQSTVTAAAYAEALTEYDQEVVFDIGCELTFFAYDLIPGDSYDTRVAYAIAHPEHFSESSEKLNDLFSRIVPEVRKEFSGRITYSSGEWEQVDWSLFDIVGVDLYRDSENAATFTDTIRTLQQFGKPVWINEFGCCTFKGAEDMGGSGYTIVDYSIDPPTIPTAYERDESVQADTILELLDIFSSEGIDQASVYQFIATDMPFNEDPELDLDTASFAIVKNWGPDSDKSYDETGIIEPKEAFTAIAKYNKSS